MKIIFDQHSVPLKPVMSTAKETAPLSMPVLSTAMHQLMRLPYQYSVLTSKNLTKGYRV